MPTLAWAWELSHGSMPTQAWAWHPTHKPVRRVEKSSRLWNTARGQGMMDLFATTSRFCSRGERGGLIVMFRVVAPTLAILAVAAAVYAGGDPISGPKPGDKLTPFKVHVFAGPSAGEEVKLLTDPKETPQVLIFVHQITRPALQLLRPVD